MEKAIQITAIVKEDGKVIEYETGKHDSISLAEKDLLDMIAVCEATTVNIMKKIYNIVDNYSKLS